MASPLQIIQNQDSISYLSQRDAAEIDEILMGPLGFSVDQLMVRPLFFFFEASLCVLLYRSTVKVKFVFNSRVSESCLLAYI